MKCPKCDYLGFDTGDRCRNCGYDFSLVTEPPDLDLRLDGPPPRPGAWLDQLDAGLTLAAVEPPPRMTPSPAPIQRAGLSALPHRDARLPLFQPPVEGDDDEPLIRLPAAPRPPLAVRKTPEIPRLRTTPRSVARIEEPVLQFSEDGAPEPGARVRGNDSAQASRTPRRDMRGSAHGAVSAAGPRLSAALIDHAILATIDATVIYFTLRMAVLPLDAWRLLPAAPLLMFLLLVKCAYFCAFTAVGGQTIGKMALSIRVVSDNDRVIDGARAIRRTCAGLASAVFGLGFVQAVFDTDHRAFHDRVAHTRVVSLRSI